MGCATSKADSVTPAIEYSGAFWDSGSEALGSGRRRHVKDESDAKKKKNKKTKSCGAKSLGDGDDLLTLRLGNLQKQAQGEQVAVGWPSWLSVVGADGGRGRWWGQMVVVGDTGEDGGGRRWGTPKKMVEGGGGGMLICTEL